MTEHDFKSIYLSYQSYYLYYLQFLDNKLAIKETNLLLY